MNKLLSVVGLLLAGNLAQAGLITVDGHVGPWDPAANSSFAYGVGDESDPVGVSVFPGGTVSISGATGLVSAGLPYWAFVGPDGDPSLVTNGEGGTSGDGFPSKYAPSDWPTYLVALMGVFADSSGLIVGTPFEIGTASLVLAVPAGASRLQLGINDDIFGDNVGSFTVDVTVTAPVPDAGGTGLGFSIGLASIAILARRQRLA